MNRPFTAAVRAFAAGDRAEALRSVLLAEPGRLREHAAAWLGRPGDTDVYARPEAFEAFIRGGGNVGLYEALTRALQARYPAGPFSLLDVGAGDGRALAALPPEAALTVIEPSRRLLEDAMERYACTGFEGTLAQAIGVLEGHWEVVQATFSLQCLTPAERPDALAWLRAHGDRLLVAEFDLPAWDDPFDPHRVEWMCSRYEQGLAEYEGPLVAEGFLIPMFFGAFTGDYTEQPISAWTEQLREAGFASIERVSLFPYWWSEAVLLVAS